jgi:hypothetical protein
MIRHALLALIPIAIAACDGFPTATSDTLSGSFVLATVEGAPLPAELWSVADFAGVLHADHLDFRPDGTVTRNYRFMITRQGTDRVEDVEMTLELEYRRRGRSIEIGRFEPCPPNALCAPNDTGRIRNGRLELESSYWSQSDRPRFTYLRLDPFGLTSTVSQGMVVQ